MSLRNKVIIGLIVLGGVFWMGRVSAPTPDPIIHETVTVDSTHIKELEQEVREWRDIAEDRRERLEAVLDIPEPTYTEADGLKVYDVSYSDKNISANIGLTVEGILKETKLEYYLKREMVVDRTRTIHETRVIKQHTTETIHVQPPRFNQSIEVGLKFNQSFIQKPYIEYKPEFRVLGFDLVGVGHFSGMDDWYIGTGIKIEF